MALTEAQYRAAVRARRALMVSDCPEAALYEMKTLSEAGWDGDYVVPNQRKSNSFDGPLIVLNNWYWWEKLDRLSESKKAKLRELGYLPDITTNTQLDCALDEAGIERSDIYITQACVLLPKKKIDNGDDIPDSAYAISAERVLRLELGGRKPVALGRKAQMVCELLGIEYEKARHPAAKGGGVAEEIADAIRQVL